jgi:hypothetical protein
MHAADAIGDRRILLLGDDDLTSIALLRFVRQCGGRIEELVGSMLTIACLRSSAMSSGVTAEKPSITRNGSTRRRERTGDERVAPEPTDSPRTTLAKRSRIWLNHARFGGHRRLSSACDTAWPAPAQV